MTGIASLAAFARIRLVALKAVHHGHAHVHKDEVGVPCLTRLDGFLSIVRPPYLEADGSEHQLEKRAVLFLVIGHEDAIALAARAVVR